MEHDIPFGNSNRENGSTFLDFPLFLRIFQWDEPTKRVPFTTEPEIPEILTKWKAPIDYFSKSLKATWIKKYLDEENKGKWKIYFDLELEFFGGKLNCSYR